MTGTLTETKTLQERAAAALAEHHAKDAAYAAESLARARKDARESLCYHLKEVLDVELDAGDERIELTVEANQPWAPRVYAFVTLDGLRFTAPDRNLEVGKRVYLVRPCTKCGEEVWDAVVHNGGLVDLAMILEKEATHVSPGCPRDEEARDREIETKPRDPSPTEKLHAKRREISTLNRRLAELDRERRAHRVKLENFYRTQINNATGKPFTQEAAGDAAAVDASYTPLLTTIDAVTFERDVLAAEAETIRLEIELEISASRPAF